MTGLPFQEKIHISSEAGIKDDISIIALGDGYQQRSENGLNAQREEWAIVYPALTKTDFQAAMAIFKTVGAVQAMTWVSPLDGLTKKYVVVKDSRKFQFLGGKYRLTLSLRQVFEP
jgi:phage-related protein